MLKFENVLMHLQLIWHHKSETHILDACEPVLVLYSVFFLNKMTLCHQKMESYGNV